MYGVIVFIKYNHNSLSYIALGDDKAPPSIGYTVYGLRNSIPLTWLLVVITAP